jgi:glycerol transport system ATP-binding protein
MRVVIEGLGRTVGGQMHLDQVDLSLAPASFTVLLGATRAGKTSLLRSIAGLDRPTAGTVRFEDDTGRTVKRVRDHVAMVYQEFVNYPSLTVFENIASPLRVRGGLTRAEVDSRVRAIAERFELQDLLGRLPSELSGGQEQRTALARALIRSADVVLLDEPLANLDYKLREGLREEILRIYSEGNSTFVYASSDPTEALWFAQHVAVLYEGRLLQEGAARDVYEAPGDERVARTISEPPMNLWNAQLDSEGRLSLTSELGFSLPEHLASLAPGDWRVGLHPHRFRAARRGDADIRIVGELELSEVTGSDTTLHLRHAGESFLAQLDGVHAFELGTSIELFFDPREAFAFAPEGRLAAAPVQHVTG